MSIKVLQIIGSGTVGGAENFVYQLARYQHEKEDEVEPAILFRQGKGCFFDKAREHGIPISVCKDRITLKDFIKIILYFRKFHILHFHGLYPMLFLAAIMSRRNCIYYIHGTRALTKDLKTVFKDIVKQDSENRIPTVSGLIRFIKRHWFKIFLKYFAKEIHAPSWYYIDFYVEKYGIPKNKIKLLPLGIDFSTIEKTKSIIQTKEIFGINDEKIVGCVSTFRSLKRIDRLIEAFALYLRNKQKDSTKLLLVGDGSERKNIEEQIQSLHIKYQVILTGLRHDVGDLLSIMDIFVLPSEFESFSISVAEAMYSKIPVIVFQGSGGAEEIVRTSGGGLLVGSEEELADKIDFLLNSTNERKRLGEEGHYYATKNYSIENISTKIREAYAQCLEHQR